MLHAPVKLAGLGGYFGLISGHLGHIYRDILTTLSHDKYGENSPAQVNGMQFERYQMAAWKCGLVTHIQMQILDISDCPYFIIS